MKNKVSPRTQKQNLFGHFEYSSPFGCLTKHWQPIANSGLILLTQARKTKKTKKNKKTKKQKTKCQTLRFQDCCSHGSCNFVFWFFGLMGLAIVFFVCLFFGFMGLAILVFCFFGFMGVLQSWYVGFIARFPCGKL